MTLNIFKILSILFLSVFFYYGYDMKKRSNWKNLAPEKSTQLMKALALVLAIVLLSAVVLINQLFLMDTASFVLFFLGAVFVRYAKIELEKNNAFTWTGYALEKPQLVTTGIYSYVRHPLYTGVYFVEIGGLILVLNRMSLFFPNNYIWINCILSLFVIYAMSFNSILAAKESQNLGRIFGDDYARYSQRVHAFIPLKFK